MKLPKPQNTIGVSPANGVGNWCILRFSILLILAMAMSGCGRNSTDKYELAAANAKIEIVSTQLTAARTQNQALTSEIQDLKSENQKMKNLLKSAEAASSRSEEKLADAERKLVKMDEEVMQRKTEADLEAERLRMRADSIPKTWQKVDDPDRWVQAIKDTCEAKFWEGLLSMDLGKNVFQLSETAKRSGVIVEIDSTNTGILKAINERDINALFERMSPAFRQPFPLEGIHRKAEYLASQIAKIKDGYTVWSDETDFAQIERLIAEVESMGEDWYSRLLDAIARRESRVEISADKVDSERFRLFFFASPDREKYSSDLKNGRKLPSLSVEWNLNRKAIYNREETFTISLPSKQTLFVLGRELTQQFEEAGGGHTRLYLEAPSQLWSPDDQLEYKQVAQKYMQFREAEAGGRHDLMLERQLLRDKLDGLLNSSLDRYFEAICADGDSRIQRVTHAFEVGEISKDELLAQIETIATDTDSKVRQAILE